MELEELTEMFEQLGAPDPKAWAESQIREGIPQLARFMVIRALWDCVAPSDSTAWIDYELKNEAGCPHAKAMQEMIDAGVSREAIATLARFKGAEAIREACYLLEDYTSVSQNIDPQTGEERIRWSLRELDEDGKPKPYPIDGLHESFWNVDPAAKNRTG